MNSFDWVMARIGSNPPNDFYCTTRDVGQARVEKLVAELIRQGWNENEAGLIAAIIGELVGNCFDHNLGAWRDIPGCWLETKAGGDILKAVVSDRGQGILSTLKQVLPTLQNGANEAFVLVSVPVGEPNTSWREPAFWQV